MCGWRSVRIQENVWAGGVFRSPSGLLVSECNAPLLQHPLASTAMQDQQRWVMVTGWLYRLPVSDAEVQLSARPLGMLHLTP